MGLPRFESLIDDHHDEIHRYLWRLSRSAQSREPDAEAADLTQETFLRAYRAYDRLRDDSNPRAWLFKIATNCARTAHHQRQRRLARAQELTPPAAPVDRQPVEDRLLERDRDQRLRAALAALPFKQRSAIALHHLEGLAYEEVGAILDCAPEAARANVYQGLKHLRRVLNAEEMSL